MTATHCPYCALQCGLNLVPAPEPSGRRWAVAPRPDFPTNRGGLCRKGWTAAELLEHPERLRQPWMRERKDAPLRPVSWEAALERATAEIRRAQRAGGPDAVALFGGGGLTNETAYLLGKFARVTLGTSRIDYNGRFCMASAAAAALRAFGLDRGLPFPLVDIARTDALLLVGGNPAECMPPVMQYFDEQQRRGGIRIVVDPRVTPTAAGATLHLQITPGTDLALANGLLHIAIRDRLLDEAFIAERTRRFESVRRVAAAYWPERVERITGVPVRQLVEAAHLFAEAPTGMILTARGAEQHRNGTETALGFINLALALGKAGRPLCGFGSLTGQGNGQGGREHGQKADQLPGYRRIDVAEDRAHVAAVWGVDPAALPGPGIPAVELLASLGAGPHDRRGPGGIRALLVFGSNPAVSAPDALRVAERLRALDFLLVADFFLSETAALADVVLPAAQWAEQEGTVTNLEGRVLLRRGAMPPPEGVRTDAEIVAALAARLGRPEPAEPRALFEELRRASAGGAADYAGITWERIAAENGVFWPCPDPAHPGTPRLFLDRFATEDGRARFHPVEHRDPPERPCAEFPLLLTTGRVMGHYQSGTQTRRVDALREAMPEPFVEIHPAMAARFRIEEGELVRVVTRRGAGLFRARRTPSIRQDTLFVPFHWGGEGCANRLTDPTTDPVSGMPEFKVCAARIERVGPRREGAAARQCGGDP